MTDPKEYPEYCWDGKERRENALTNKDKEWIVDAIIKHHKCPFCDEDFRAVQKLLDIHRTMGNGDLNAGVEKFRDHTRFISAVLNKKTVLAGAGLVAVIGFLAVEVAKKLIAVLWP